MASVTESSATAVRAIDDKGTVRSVLDNLLFNNNNLSNNQNLIGNNNGSSVGSPKSEISTDESEMSCSNTAAGPGEAVEHGEKFLKWLESCSDPSITAMQVMQFRTLLNSIKSSADRASQPIIANEERTRTRRRK